MVYQQEISVQLSPSHLRCSSRVLPLGRDMTQHVIMQHIEETLQGALCWQLCIAMAV